MEARFELRPAVAGAALAGFGAAHEDELVVTDGDAFAQALMVPLMSAELMAATAGVIPFVDLGNGDRGVVAIGGARAIIDDPTKWHKRVADVDPKAVQTLYLGAHGRVRTAHGASSRAPSSTPSTLILPPRVKASGERLAPVVVLAVLGVAAIVATAYYATSVEETKVRVAGDVARAVAVVDSAQKIAMKELLTTGQINPETYKLLGSVAAREERASWLPYAVGAGATVAAGVGLYALKRRYLG